MFPAVYSGHSILHIIQLYRLLGHMFIKYGPVFPTMDSNTEYWVSSV